MLFRFALLYAVVIMSAVAQQPIPRSEHPNPQAIRKEWVSLNGEWEFGESNEDEAARFLGEAAYPEKIVVPFCRESKLSGIGRREFVKNVWYRRSFAVPADWKSPRVRLHVGACDWRTTAWVNGEQVGEHTGGNVSFCFEVTKYLKRGEANRVVIHAFDDTASGNQPLGKQSITGKSESIFYTQTTGIWQSVWLEGVGESFIREIRIEPRPESSVALLSVDIDGPTTDLMIDAEVYDGETKLARGMAHAQRRDNKLLLNIPKARLWSPEDPVLHNIRLQLMHGKNSIDEMGTYFGMRSVAIDGNAVLINGKPVFQRLVLDQGFYPDGVWTAPSDDALRRDIELAKAAGFNGARLHQKVFEPRFLYWADKLGYLAWGEYPSYGANYADPVVNAPIVREWTEIIARDRNHPSIIGWCPFNETPAAAAELQDTVMDLTRQLDPARPVLETSGWVHHVPDPEMLDAHDYDQNPETFRERYAGYFPWQAGVGLPDRYKVGTLPKVPFFISEYGGIGWSLDENAWGYGNTPESIEAFYTRFDGLASALLDSRYLFGLCYTQLTDIEQEQNGIYYYDRSPKFDIEKLRSVIAKPAAYEQNPPTAKSMQEALRPAEWNTLVGSIHDGDAAKEWRYVATPPAAGWEQPDFDASIWTTGRAPFGLIGGEYGDTIQTKWREDELWLRQEFEATATDFELAILVLFHDDNIRIWLNGQEVFQRDGWSTQYQAFNVTEALRPHLKQGKNTLAVHLKQDKGGQFFDMALLTGKVVSTQ